MKNISSFLPVVLCGILLFCLSGCGKISDPKPVPDSGYPHVYPKI